MDFFHKPFLFAFGYTINSTISHGRIWIGLEAQKQRLPIDSMVAYEALLGVDSAVSGAFFESLVAYAGLKGVLL
ncbi:MAG: hypothetical protein JOZ51_28480 [Chloroflexi bacterium]|nr:hypothetical protein [Chloroflexota bacterium]